MTEQKNQPEAAGFLNPFKWGKKKKEETKAEKAAANPPVAQSEPTPAPTPEPTPPPAAPEPTPVPAAARKYTVRPGDTLWDIAVRYYGDGQQYTKIAQANKIPNPDMINVGTELTIPD